MWNLKHDTCTVTGLVVCSLCTSMAHVFQYFQCVVYKLMAFVAMNVDNHSDATCIVLITGRIQSISHISVTFNL